MTNEEITAKAVELYDALRAPRFFTHDALCEMIGPIVAGLIIAEAVRDTIPPSSMEKFGL